MKIYFHFFAGAVIAMTVQNPLFADSDTEFLQTGKRLLVKTEGREDYNPRIVSCDSSIVQLCIRDTRGNPPDNPLEPFEDGSLRVEFKSWNIVYLIYPDGTGRTFTNDDKELTPFKWTMIPD